MTGKQTNGKQTHVIRAVFGMKKRMGVLSILLCFVFVITGCNHTNKSAAKTTSTDTVSADTASTDSAFVETASAKATSAKPPTESAAESSTPYSGGIEAVYLGVKNYGAKETNKDHKNNFFYRFKIDGKETIFKIDNGKRDEQGNYDYPIQNLLKEGYTYTLVVKNGKVVSATQKGTKPEAFTPVVQGKPGEKTLTNFLKTALEPVGTTLYIYGGGWDWQDVGSSVQARSLGVSSDWIRFFNSQDRNFTYREKDGNPTLADPRNSYYPYGEYNAYYYAGLDCSGYLGWALYNTMETKNGKEGYVGSSTGFAKRLAEKGWGTRTQDIKAPDSKNGYAVNPGDVMSINGHVWLSLGTCEDGSVLILHSTPSKSRTGQPGGGVQISAIGNSETCRAYALADQYMATYYAKWYARYPVYLCNPNLYFSFSGNEAGNFRWDVSGKGVLTDPDGLQKMKPEAVLKQLFS